MINIEKLLIENAALDGYKINGTKTESYEMFFVKGCLETVRSTDTEDLLVTVYKDHDGKKGDASFRVYASTTEEEAKEKIADAVAKASIIGNQYYDLPAGEELDGKVPSDFEGQSLSALAATVADAVHEADVMDKGSINALEIFVNKLTVTVKNSRGINKREVKYNAMVEAIPTWNDGESVELYHQSRFSALDKDHIREELNEMMRQVRDRGDAKPPEAKLTCPVMLRSPEVANLVGDLVGELGYGAVYSHSNFFSEGDDIQKAPTGDKLTATMRGSIVGSVHSALFDGDGTTLKDTTVIKDGKAVRYYGGSRFAQYLQREVTGALPCVEVEAGSVKDITTPYFECASMSGLQLDVYNDYIGGEVRLGYYVEGGKKTPVTGVSLSGKLSDALNSMKLSDACESHGSYYGPKFAIFEGIEIV